MPTGYVPPSGCQYGYVCITEQEFRAFMAERQQQRRRHTGHTEVAGRVDVIKHVIVAEPKTSYTLPDGRVCSEEVSKRYTNPTTGELNQFWVNCK